MLIDRDAAALEALSEKHGAAVTPLVIDLLDAKDCATLMPRVFETTGRLDILHANAGLYVGGNLVDADTGAIDRMLNLNVNVVIKNVHDALPHMIERGSGDIIVTSSRLTFRLHGSPFTLRRSGPSIASFRRCGDRCSSTGFAWVRSLPARSPARCSRIGRRRS